MEGIQTCEQPQPVVETGFLILSVYYPDQDGPIVIQKISECDSFENDGPLSSIDEKQSKNVAMNIIQVNIYFWQIQNYNEKL